MFSPEQTDEEVLAAVIASYFTSDELERARELAHTQSYEAAIGYLAQAGQQSLRDSGEPPPRVYITIPGGRVLIHHPARLFPEPVLYALSVTHLALQAFPPPPVADDSDPFVQKAAGVTTAPPPSFFDGSAPRASPLPGALATKKGKGKPARPQKCVFVAQAIRIGTKRQFWTRNGWAVKKGFLGYVLTKLPSGAYRVELIHLVSYWVLASMYLDELDETTHVRLQGWVSDAHALTDWSRGINAILKEKSGKDKKWAWSKQLEELWQARRLQPRQLSFF